jgi:hypothetical protein
MRESFNQRLVVDEVAHDRRLLQSPHMPSMQGTRHSAHSWSYRHVSAEASATSGGRTAGLSMSCACIDGMYTRAGESLIARTTRAISLQGSMATPGKDMFF